MTDNEIIKGLECCGVEQCCKGCPYKEVELSLKTYCQDQKDIDARDLINRQKAEIERLKENINEMLINDAKIGRALKQLKSEARKEFAERLMKKSFYMAGHTYDDIQVKGVTERQIDETLTELTEKGR